MFGLFIVYFSLLLLVLAKPHNNEHLINKRDQDLIAGKTVVDIEAVNLKSSINGLRNYGREEARKETETKLSQIDSSYTNLQKKTNDYLNIKPIVDRISEHEKYGNDGGINRVASVAFVNGYENIANFINAIFEAPSGKLRVSNEKIGEVLRFFGRKISGLY